MEEKVDQQLAILPLSRPRGVGGDCFGKLIQNLSLLFKECQPVEESKERGEKRSKQTQLVQLCNPRGGEEEEASRSKEGT